MNAVDDLDFKSADLDSISSFFKELDDITYERNIRMLLRYVVEKAVSPRYVFEDGWKPVRILIYGMASILHGRKIKRNYFATLTDTNLCLW